MSRLPNRARAVTDASSHCRLPILVVAKALQATDSVVPAPENAPAAAVREDATPTASTPFDEPEVVPTEPEEYVPPETPVVAVPPPRPPPPAVPAGLRAGEFGRQRAMSSVKRQTSLPDVVNIAIGYRNEDGTKFPWWYNVTDGRGASNATQTAGPETVDPILYNPVLENPDYDVAWYQRYFVNYGACGCIPGWARHRHVLTLRGAFRGGGTTQSTTSSWASTLSWASSS